MVDVDGVLIDGRPEDGRHWQTSIADDLGIDAATLHEEFFVPCWEDVVLGRVGLVEHLTPALGRFAPHVDPATFISYWFARDSRIVTPLLRELSSVRSMGVRVYLATNQEHLRAAFLMDDLGLAQHVDGMFYSARLGTKKPELKFFAEVQRATGLSAADILLIDDSAQNIEAARKAGWEALHWTPQSSPDALGTYVFGTGV